MLIGFTSIIGVATDIFERFDGGDNIPSEDYYPAVKAGNLLCPGRFSISEVASALERNPEFVSEVDAFLARDSAWQAGKFGPLTTSTQKASAAVNWAHGGRNCRVTEGEISPQLAAILDRLMSTDAKRLAEQQTQADRIGSQLSETLEEQGVSPLQLGLGAVTLFLLLRGS